MDNAPTRRPKNYPDRRRPQRGPRPVTGSIRDRLTAGAAELKRVGADASSEADRLSEAGDTGPANKARERAEVAYDSAAALEAVLAPRGYLLLSRSEGRAPSTVRRSTDSLSLSTTVNLKAAIEAAAEEYDVPFPPHGLAEEAYQMVLEGRWVPSKPVKMPKGMGGGQAVLNVMLKSELRHQVREKLPELTEQLGFKVTEGNIIMSYVCDQLGIERPNTGDQESLHMRFPKTLVQHWEQQAAEQGVTLRGVVEGMIPALLDGSWVPERSSYMTSERGPRRPGWSESDRQRLWLPIDKELLADLRAKAEELSEQLGFLVYPGSIVRAILTDRLGEPTE